jgi:hypothetical protein
MISHELLSKKQRARTTLSFAEYLVGMVRDAFDVYTVNALWLQADSEYLSIPGVQCWTMIEDARTWDHSSPIIAHPPCGPWGKYSSRCTESKYDGKLAMDFVHCCGGVVEQPLGSSLFRAYGSRGAIVQEIDQGEFGFPSRKPTLLYWWIKEWRYHKYSLSTWM